MAGLLPLKIKDQIQNEQKRRSVEMASHILETYKNSVMLHGHHIYQIEYEMTVDTMCAYPLLQHALPHRKFVLYY